MAGFRPRFFVSPEAVSASGEVRGEPDPDLSGIGLTLSPADSHHALRVLRLGPGDECEIVVGAAVYAASVVEAVNPVKVDLLYRLEGVAAGARYRAKVGVVQGLARPTAMDYVMEKGTEVGASFFVLVQASGSPKGSDPSRGDRLTRWLRIAQEAAKQSKQVELPRVQVAGSLREAAEKLEDWGASTDPGGTGRDGSGAGSLGDVGCSGGVGGAGGTGTLSLVLDPGAADGLFGTLAPLRSGCSRVGLWVGPEGGWTDAEMDLFSGMGMRRVRLGRSVLRAETAGPVGVAVARLALQDW